MNEPVQVYLVDDDDDLRHALMQGLELAGFGVQGFSGGSDVLECVGRDFEGIVVCDIRMPGMDGLGVLKAILDLDAALPVILITGHGDVPVAVEAMRSGAYDFIEKPFPVSDLVAVVKRALEKRRLVLENRVLRDYVDGRQGLEETIVGRSPGIVHLRNQVSMLAGTDIDILLMGETGSGKEVVARALHDHGPRKKEPFVAINCAAMPADIFESELFGHEKGTFTGAHERRIGKLEHAGNGTVFLDEIESMPLDLQAKLLRVIETRSIERLGSNTALPLGARFVAATKADLEGLSRQGKFREDLVYRLNVVTLTIPPLRQRREDVLLLFHHLARLARARYRQDYPEPSADLQRRLLAQDWPGNVRELRNVADRFVLGLMPDEQGLSGEAPEASGREASGGTLSEQVARFEKQVLVDEIRRQGGSLKATYETLGLSRKGLYDKMQKYRIDRQDLIEADGQDS
ncbi:sigma-54-dependent transcriptional regulator [Coralliovum pocilloporae]|uniref:sigma-54-dependent transcriptional regulator n=1 Tax=Coralliovum pocilloporae TaxID=3066369 RepID=UPI003306BA0E